MIRAFFLRSYDFRFFTLVYYNTTTLLLEYSCSTYCSYYNTTFYMMLCITNDATASLLGRKYLGVDSPVLHLYYILSRKK